MQLWIVVPLNEHPMENEQETAKERLRALLTFPELTLSEYSQDAYAEKRVGAALIGHTQEARPVQSGFQTFYNKF